MKAIYQDYVIDFENYVGQGQYSIVLQCQHKESKYKDTKLCAKIIKQQETFEDKQMLYEIQILKTIQQFNHRHLVKVFDMFEEDNQYFIIMEHCTKGDLKNLILNRKKTNQLFKVSEILDFVYQFIQAYQVLHDNKIIHRDIKPQNIFIDQNQIYKIGDLGSGRILEDVNKKEDYTKVGSPIYSSPQIIQSDEYSSQTDVYSLGIIIFELTFLCLPFQAILPSLQIFISQIKEKKFSMNNYQLQNEGSKNEKNELIFLLENMLVYDENNRITWKSLFERMNQQLIYQQFSQEYIDQLQSLNKMYWDQKKLKRCKDQAKELKSGIRLFKNKNNNQIQLIQMIPKIVFENKNSPLTMYLTLQVCKAIIADQALLYLFEVVDAELVSISVIDFYLLACAIFGYEWNLLKSIEEMKKGHYKLQCIQTNQELQYSCESKEDSELMKFSSQQLQNLPEAQKIVEQTIAKINEQKIRFQNQCEMRDILLQFQTYIDYHKFWQFIIQFFEQSLGEQFQRFLQNDTYKQSESLLFCMVYMYELCELEEKYKQLDIFKNKKRFMIPQKFYQVEEALQYLNKKKN